MRFWPGDAVGQRDERREQREQRFECGHEFIKIVAAEEGEGEVRLVHRCDVAAAYCCTRLAGSEKKACARCSWLGLLEEVAALSCASPARLY